MCRSAVGSRAVSRALLAGVVVLVAACGGSAAPSAASVSAVASASTIAVVLPSPSESGSAPEPPLESPSMDLPAESPSDEPSDAPTPAPVDPCSLITRAEANTVTGTKPGAPMPAGDPVVHCTWPTPTTGSVGQVEIEVGDGAKKAYDIDHDVLKHKFAAVAGLGDEAYREDGAVFFRVGDTWVAINVVRLDDASRWMPKLIALARTVAGRLAP